MFASGGALQAACENFVADPATLRARRWGHRPSLAAAVLSLVALGTFLVVQLSGGPAYHHGISSAQRQRLASAYARLPLSFEENHGQSDPRVRFLVHGPGFGLFLTSQGPVLSLARAKSPSDVVALRLLGATSHPRLEGLGRLAGRANYLVGSDRTRWRTGVPTFSRVRYAQVWPGVSVDFHGNRSRLEYDLNLAPGADPARVAFAFAGARSLHLTGNGDLLVGLAHSGLRQPRPLAYQWLGSHRQPVPAGYALGANGRVGLQLGPYDHSRALVVDPILYDTNLGNGEGRGIAVDSSGDAYVAGTTPSGVFTTTAGAFQTTRGGFTDAFVTKLDAGGGIIYSTYLGGSGVDEGHAIAIDSSGDAFVTGTTASPNFPTTAGAFQTTQGGPFDNAFVTKLNASGSALLYSTYLGGEGNDAGNGIAVDSSGDAYLTGVTQSTNFPTTAGAFQTTFGGGSKPGSGQGCGAGPCDAFVTKLNASGSGLLYSTYLGGSGNDTGSGIAVDSSGDAYLTGETDSTNFPTTAGAFQTIASFAGDAFVTKLNASGSALLYSTYLGNNGADKGYGIAIDSSGDAYLTGYTSSSNFPTTAGAYQTSISGPSDAFITKLNASGSGLLYSTYLGGSGADQALGIALDSSGDAYLTGSTTSTNFPTTPGALRSKLEGTPNAYVTKLNATGSGLLYSTYLGEIAARGIAVDSSGNAYLTGSPNAYVTKLTPTPLTLTAEWFKSGVQLPPGEKVGTIGWGTLTLESSAGNTTCHSAQAANVENPPGGARQETVLLVTWECKAIGGKCAANEARLSAKSLPWSATVHEEGELGSEVFRQQAAGIELDSECYVGGKLTESLTFKTGPVLTETGTSTPAWLNGTTATKPSEVFFDASSGHLSAESEGKPIPGTPKGKLKVVGYQDNATTPTITVRGV